MKQGGWYGGNQGAQSDRLAQGSEAVGEGGQSRQDSSVADGPKDEAC